MISLISPALIIPAPLPVRQSFPDARQLAVEAAVHDEAADLGDEAAEEVLIDDLLHDHLRAAEGAAEPLGQRRTVGLGQRHRAAHARAHAAAGGVEHGAIRLRDGAEVIGAAVGGDQVEEVAGEPGELQALPDLVGQLAPRRRADPRASEHRGKLAVAGDQRRGPLQLGFDRLGLVALAGQLEQRLRVRLRDGGRRSHETFIPAIASATMRRWSSSRSVLCTSFSATATARSLTSRRNSSRARRTSVSSWVLVSSTSLRAWAWAAAMCLRDSSAASFSACSRTAAASA